MARELIMMCGLPRSGKTTYVDKHFGSYQIVCADDIREGMGIQFNPAIEDFVWACHHSIVRAHMVRGSSIVLDSTNCVLERYIQWQRECDLRRYKLIVYLIDTPIEACLARNTGKGSVPNAIIHRMHNQLTQLLEKDYFRDLEVIRVFPADFSD